MSKHVNMRNIILVGGAVLAAIVGLIFAIKVKD